VMTASTSTSTTTWSSGRQITIFDGLAPVY
jgi:hypothetical protein